MIFVPSVQEKKKKCITKPDVLHAFQRKSSPNEQAGTVRGCWGSRSSWHWKLNARPALRNISDADLVKSAYGQVL